MNKSTLHKLKLAVFPVGSIDQYLKKGEFRKRYFNPDNYFSEIHIMNLSTKTFSEEEKKKLQFMMGTAKLYIHNLGNYSFFATFIHRKKIAKTAYDILSKVKPDVIRAYGNSLEGYFGMYCAERLKTLDKFNVKFLVSIHTNMDMDQRYFSRIDKEYGKYVFYTYWKYSYELKILKRADLIICVYKFIEKYLLENDIKQNKIRQMYNRIYLDIYKPLSKYKSKEFTLINVSNLHHIKNQGQLIEAVAGLPDVKLILIGDGPKREEYMNLAKELGAKNVEFILSVPNYELPKYYNKATAYLSALKQNGVSIPSLEAAACGLPLIIAKPIYGGEPELLSKIALVPENNTIAIRKAIIKLKNDKKLREEMSSKSLKLIKTISGDKMEKYEADVYDELIHLL